MKKTLLLLLISFTAFSQPDKDALLAKEHAEVIEKFKLMNYLDSIAMSYYTTLKIRNKAEDDKTFYRFYIDNIVKNNPVASLEVPVFLGYTGYEAPMTWTQFGDRVASKNMEALIEMIEKYGYISTVRMKPYTTEPTTYTAILFVSRESGYDKQVKKLFKKEYRIGNMPKQDYNMFNFVVQRKGTMTAQDMKKLEKNGNKIVLKDN